MESTGVFWVPLFELLESRGFDVRLVDARQVHQVAGRPKSDVYDCQWLQRLHTFGLLASAFRPAEQVCVLRGYLRQRAMLVAYASRHVQHMQKALTQMNVKLQHVVSDVTGVTGMAIIRAILAGQRDPARLAKLRDRRCKHAEGGIAQALDGRYRPEHLTELRGEETAPWSIEADVSVVEDLGAERLVFFPLDVKAAEPDDIVRVREGEEQAGLMAVGDGTILTARLPSTARAVARRRIRLALHPDLCHFFDPGSGDSLLARRPAPTDEVPVSLTSPLA
jgi:hypothetical protein